MICGIIDKLATLGCDLRKELGPTRRVIIRVSTYVLPRIIFFCWGFYWIEKKSHRITDLDPTYPKDKPALKVAPMIVSNHISFLDIFYYLTSRHCPGFLSKASIAKVPFVGTIARARQGIFVNRTDRKEKDVVLEDIKLRVENIQAGKSYPPILIYPEGTTSNGESIISFKKGAFFSLAPMRIMCLEYPKETFSPAYDNLEFVVIFLGLLSQFYNRIRVHDCGIYDPSHLNLKEESDWVIYSDKVRAIMSKCVGLPTYEIGYQEKMEYYKYTSELKKQLRGGRKDAKKTE